MQVGAAPEAALSLVGASVGGGDAREHTLLAGVHPGGGSGLPIHHADPPPMACAALGGCGSAPAAGTAWLSAAPHGGEVVDVGQWGTRVTHATPAYFTEDKPRSLALVYLSGTTMVRGLVQVDATDESGTPPEMYSLRVQEVENGAVATLHTGLLENFYQGGAGTTRLAAQIDIGHRPTGAYRYRVLVRKWRGGQVYDEGSVELRVIGVNERGSPWGAGWSVAGWQRLHAQADGSVLITDGSGRAVLFTPGPGCGPGCTRYVTPEGDFTSLVRRADASYLRTYPGGSTVEFTAAGLPLSVKDRYGKAHLRYSYDGLNRLVRLTDPADRFLHIAYGPTGLAASVTDPGGRVTTLQHTGPTLTAVTDPDGVTALALAYTGDLTYRVVEWTERETARWSVEYDHAGGMAELRAPQVLAGGAHIRPTSTFVSLPSRVVPAAAGPASPAPRVDLAALYAEERDPRGAVTRVRVDRFGQPVEVVDPLGRVELSERNGSGRVVRTASIGGDTVDYAYDASGINLTQVTDRRTGRVVRMTYTADNGLLTATGGDRPVQNVYQEEVDAGGWPTGRLTFLESSRVGSSHYWYEYNGPADERFSAVYGPGEYSTYGYGLSGARNLTMVIADNGARTAFSHDGLGRVETVTDPAGGVTRYVYDEMNRRVRVIGPEQDTTTTFYGTMYPDSLRTAQGQTYRTSYNALGWIVEQRDPQQYRDSVWYDPAGNPVRLKDRSGRVTLVAYDSAGRVSRIAGEGGTGATDYRYAPRGDWIAAANGESVDTVRVVREGPHLYQDQVAVRGGRRFTLRSRHEADGFRYWVHDDVPRTLLTYDYHVSYSRDAASGALQSVAAFAAPETRFGHDAGVGRHFQVLPAGDTLFRTVHSLSFSDPVLESRLGFVLGLDTIARVVRRSSAAGDSARTYAYDTGRRLATVTRLVKVSAELCPIAPSRLRCIEQSRMAAQDSTRYSWDRTGNPRHSGAVVGADSRLTRFGGMQLNYDRAGYVIRKYDPVDSLAFNQRMSYNPLGDLVRVATTREGTTRIVTYGYDGFGRRVRRTTGGVSTYYVYDGDHLAMEVDAAGNKVAQYAYYPGEDLPFAMQRAGRTYHYVGDDAGNVVALLDSAGAVAAAYRYSPFGETLAAEGSVANPLRFQGRELDEVTGLYHFRARWYDPQLQRFISQDPLGFVEGVNPYAYAGSDPVNGRDPSGLSQCKKIRYPVDPDVAWQPAYVPQVPGWTSSQGPGWAMWCPTGSVLAFAWGTSWLDGRFLRIDPADEAAYDAYMADMRASAENARVEEGRSRPVTSALDVAEIAGGFAPGASTLLDLKTVLAGRTLSGERVGLGGRAIAMVGLVTPVSGAHLRTIAQRLSRAGWPRHHIFPQARGLAARIGTYIDIHQHTVVVPPAVHRYLHGGGPQGGRWNREWRQFFVRDPNADAPEIYRQAHTMIEQYGLSNYVFRQYDDW